MALSHFIQKAAEEFKGFHHRWHNYYMAKSTKIVALISEL